jgi:hypothetical protein
MTNPNPYTGGTINDGFIQLTSGQKNHLQQLYDAENYPEAERKTEEKQGQVFPYHTIHLLFQLMGLRHD